MDTVHATTTVGRSKDSLFFAEGDIVLYDDSLVGSNNLVGVGIVTFSNSMWVGIKWWQRGDRKFSPYSVNVNPACLYKIGRLE